MNSIDNSGIGHGIFLAIMECLRKDRLEHGKKKFEKFKIDQRLFQLLRGKVLNVTCYVFLSNRELR